MPGVKEPAAIVSTPAELNSSDRPGAHESVSAEASSLNLSGPKPAGEQIRHRTDLRYPVAGGEAIELGHVRKDANTTATSLSVDVESGGDVQARGQPAAQESETMTTIDPAREAEYRRKSLIHFLALCWSLFVNGWNDATTGPMLPRIQEKYNASILVRLQLW